MTADIVGVDADGRITLPDGIVDRWRNRTVVVADLGEGLVLRAADGSLRGKYRGRGPSTLEARAAEREG